MFRADSSRDKLSQFNRETRIILAFAAGVRNLTASMSEKIFIGTDSGATTTKFSAVRENGEAVSSKVLQRPTSSE
jgi:activator of 2-hydroxyglutaryl-CoA dehydratase